MDLQAAQPVFASLTPVFLLIAAGVVAGRAGWIRLDAVKDLSNLAFMLLIPALLFRTMSNVHVEQLDLRPIGAYFFAALGFFAVLIAVYGFTARGVVMALAGVFSNMVMIGITLVELAYGQAGLVTLLTLISVHSLVLLTVATVVLEMVTARDARARGQGAQQHMALTVLTAVKNGIIHPVPLPIIVGLLFAQTGLTLPEVVDKPLTLLGNALGPLALVLGGVTLTQVRVGPHLKSALGISLLKNLALPALVATLGLALGMQGLPLNVMIVTASLPIGANVFLFAQRYEVAQDLVTASMTVSTALGLATVTLVMSLV